MGDVQVTQPQDTQEITRRSFYIGAIYGLWAAIASILSLPALIYLFFPPRVKKTEEWVEVTDLSKLPANVPTEIVFRRNRVDGWKVQSEKSTAWVVKHADNSASAFGPQCTHLGCAYHWEESKNQFLCPCHSSLFAIDGRVVSGPAQRPLDRYDAKIVGTKLLLGQVRQSEEG